RHHRQIHWGPVVCGSCRHPRLPTDATTQGLRPNAASIRDERSTKRDIEMHRARIAPVDRADPGSGNNRPPHFCGSPSRLGWAALGEHPYRRTVKLYLIDSLIEANAL